MAILSPNQQRSVPRKLFVVAAMLALLAVAGANLSALIEQDRMLLPHRFDESGRSAKIALDEEFVPAGLSAKIEREVRVEATLGNIEVLVARHAFDIGTAIRYPERMFHYKPFIRGQEPTGAIVQFADLKDRLLKRALRAGDHITADDLAAKNGSALAYRLPDGMRAVGIRVNNESSASGYADFANSDVDIVHTVRRGADGEAYSQVLLENVKVLAADSETKRNADGQAVPANVVTLALSPEDALKVTMARELGTLSVIQRRFNDSRRLDSLRITGSQVVRDPQKSSAAIPDSPGPVQIAQEKKNDTEKPSVQMNQKPPAGLKIIRTGDMAFEVDAFDAAVLTIHRLVSVIEGGFVATINSENLSNGKVRGAMVVRMPPDRLDAFVLAVRSELGQSSQLKRQNIVSEDVTKSYTDLDSRLRAAKTMEDRLLAIIRDGKGEIKDLIEAEKQVGVWRTKIEEIEGELRFYDNRIALSTLTINLTEKEIRTAATITESERVQTGIEVDDVEKAFRDALQAVADANGRVMRSELKQRGSGQFNALVHFEVAPDVAGPIRDQLRQLGNTVRLEIDRLQEMESGSAASRNAKVERGNTQFEVSLFNLANVTPRETRILKLAAPDVPGAYRKLLDTVTEGSGRILNASLNERDRQNMTANLDVSVRRSDARAFQTALSENGEVLSRDSSRLPEGDSVSDSLVHFQVELIHAANIAPRRTVTLVMAEVADVERALTAILAQVEKNQGRPVGAPKRDERDGRGTAQIKFDVPLNVLPELEQEIKRTGQVDLHRVAWDLDAPEGKFAVGRLVVSLTDADTLVPRDEGLFPQIRKGLSISLRGLAVSVSWIIVAVFFLLPWVLILLVGIWLTRRWIRKSTTAAIVPSGQTAT